MRGLKIAVIGGGSSYTPELIDGFIKRADELPISEIYLADVYEGSQKLEIVSALAKRMLTRAGIDTLVKSSLDRRSALEGADFVVTQFRVGGLKARALDEEIPLRYNVIGQETTGAGGFAKAIRTIPVMAAICKDMEQLAPDAWLINFTNPSGIITEMVHRFTKTKIIGLCNVPIGMVNNISKVLGVDSSRVTIDFVGLNHLVWGKNVYLDGERITEKVLQNLCDGESINIKNIPDLKMDSDFLKSLGMIPCPYHRYYYMTEEMLSEQMEEYKSGAGTRATQVMNIEKELFKAYNEIKLDKKPEQLEKRGGAYYSDVAVSLIDAIYNNKNEIHAVNVRNNGAISNLPEDVVIEANSVINKTGAHPLTIGRLDDKINGLVQSVKAYELLTVQAAVSGDYHTALQALICNPLVRSVHTAKKIFDDILKENEKFLPQFKALYKEG